MLRSIPPGRPLRPCGASAALPGMAWACGRCGSLAGLGRPSVAIVGTRAATPYGRRLARTFARDLGAAGCAIVSGLALGIDAAAHEGALDAGAPTIGVLGSGHDRFFPRRNLELARRIVDAQGAVLSPFPPEQEAAPWHFLARNAIVAALADAVVVIEAPARSGALNTAGWAAPRIPVLAVPGDVDRDPRRRLSCAHSRRCDPCTKRCRRAGSAASYAHDAFSAAAARWTAGRVIRCAFAAASAISTISSMRPDSRRRKPSPNSPCSNSKAWSSVAAQRGLHAAPANRRRQTSQRLRGSGMRRLP